MIGKIKDYVLVDSDRAVNIVVELFDDTTRELIETTQFVVSIDTFSRLLVLNRLNDFIDRKILEQKAIPLTKAQLEAILPLGFESQRPE